MGDKLLTVYQSRLADAGGWCEAAESADSMLSILRQKYPFEKNKIVFSRKVAERFKGIELSGIDIETVHPNDRRLVLAEAELGITTCDGLIAETGTAVLVNHASEPRELSLLPERHVVIAVSGLLYASLDECLRNIQASYPTGIMPSITLISGPSRTSDIEKTLVVGVHGPKEFGVVVCGK